MNNIDILEKMKQDDENFMEDVVIYNLEKFIRYCNNSSNFEYDYDFKQHKEVGYLILTLIAENKELKEFKENIEKIDKKQLDKLYKDAQKALKEYRETQNKVAKLEEENARLKNKNSFDVYKMGQESQRSRIERDYIPKIKVREALKEEQERLKKGLGKFYNNNLGNSATRILQSLLGKE